MQGRSAGRIGVDSRCAWTKGVLVGRQLRRLRMTFDIGFARHVGGDIHDAWTRRDRRLIIGHGVRFLGMSLGEEP